MYEIYINYNKINSNYKYIIYNIIIIKIYKIISNFGFFDFWEGESQRGERERENPKQIPRPAQNLTWDLTPKS